MGLLAGACTDDDDSARGDSPSEGVAVEPALFDQGCPEPGRALGRKLDVDGAVMAGERSVAASGDYLMANESSAFVISAPVDDEAPQRTWYHYGGIVVDAAAVEGCEQVSPDGVDEVGLIVGELDLAEASQSVLRAFRAESVEVMNDGSDGEAALVRATGSDDLLRLIELTLVRDTASNGGRRALSEPLGIRVEVDYVLEPDEPVLEIVLRVVAETPGARDLLGAAIVTWGDEFEAVSRSETSLDLGGFGFGLGTPWQAAHGEDGSLAFAVSEGGGDEAVTEIAGVNAFIDGGQALGDPLAIDDVGDSAETIYLLSVGQTDANSALVNLLAHGSQKESSRVRSSRFSGTVTDVDGDPVDAPRIEIQMSRDGEDWSTYDVVTGDDVGSFDAELLVLDDAGGVPPELRVVISSPGRSELVEQIEDAGGTGLSFEMGSAGEVEVDVTDGDGNALPARISLYQGEELVQEIDTSGAATHAVAPGRYEAVVSRGFEFDRDTVMLEVPDAGSTSLSSQLDRVVDTAGWITLDTHVHTAPSPDSMLATSRRIQEAAAVGLESLVHTEHEIITDLSDARDESGVSEEVFTLTGQEVTASSPEHTTMYSVEPDGTERGGNVVWYEQDLGEIFALERERGAEVRGLNHPAGYFDVIEWDARTSTPGLDDPTLIGLPADSDLWSWDFEQMELQNGPRPVLRSDADDDGLFDIWQSMFNNGHRIAGVGASDAHGLALGDIFTYVRVPDDRPSKVTDDDITGAVTSGAVVVSTGAFAEVLIDGAGPGETASLDSGTVEVALRVEAAPDVDVTSIRVFSNCDQVDQIDLTDQSDVTRFDGVIPIELDADANITVLGFGSAPLPRPFDDVDANRVPRFTSNPVFVDVDGNGTFDPPGPKGCDYPRA